MHQEGSELMWLFGKTELSWMLRKRDGLATGLPKPADEKQMTAETITNSITDLALPLETTPAGHQHLTRYNYFGWV